MTDVERASLIVELDRQDQEELNRMDRMMKHIDDYVRIRQHQGF